MSKPEIHEAQAHLPTDNPRYQDSDHGLSPGKLEHAAERGQAATDQYVMSLKQERSALVLGRNANPVVVDMADRCFNMTPSPRANLG